MLVTFCHGNAQSKQKKKPNILFICVDDLRRELGVYGSEVITPNIDGLAADGSLFLNHYAQVPTSGASRACMLTGCLPKIRVIYRMKHVRLDFQIGKKVMNRKLYFIN